MAEGTIRPPLGLGNLTEREGLALDDAKGCNGRTTTLWQAVKCHFGFPTRKTTKRSHANPKTIRTAVWELKDKHISDSGEFGDCHRQEPELGLPVTFERMAPWNKVRSLAATRADSALVLEFLTLGGDLDIPRSAQAPFDRRGRGLIDTLDFPTASLGHHIRR